MDALASLRKKGLEYKVKEHPDYVRNFSDDIAWAASACHLFSQMDAAAFQNWILLDNCDRHTFDR